MDGAEAATILHSIADRYSSLMPNAPEVVNGYSVKFEGSLKGRN